MNTKPQLGQVTTDVEAISAKPELRFDPLDVTSLPPTEGMELDYRTEIQSPQEQETYTIRQLCRWGAIFALGTLATNALNILLGGWWLATAILLVAVLAALWCHTRSVASALRLEVTFACLVFGAFSFWMLSPTTLAPIMGVFALLVPLGLAILLANRVTGHYLHWLNASPALTRHMRGIVHTTLCRRPFDFDFNRTFRRLQEQRLSVSAPTEHDDWRLQLAERQGKREARRYPRGLAITAAIAVLLCVLAVYFDNTESFNPTYAHPVVSRVVPVLCTTTAVVVCPCLLFLFIITRAILYTARGVCNVPQARTRAERLLNYCDPGLVIAWRAVVSYFAYNRHGTNAPGVFHSPYGPWWQRRVLVALVLATSYMSFLRLMGYGVVPAAWCISRGPDSLLLVVRATAPPWPWETSAHAAQSEDDAISRAAATIGHPEGYLLGVVRAVFQAKAHAFIIFPASIVVALMVPLCTLLMVVGSVGAHILAHAEARLRDGGRYTDSERAAQTRIAALTARLSESPYETRDASGAVVRERDHILAGFNLLNDYPVLMHHDILRGHMHYLGDTGSGKSALGLANLCHQLMRRPNMSIVILDLKGDHALFHGVRREAKLAGRDFKGFTNRARLPTIAFNPLLQRHVQSVTPHQRTEMLLNSLGLEYGEGYGAAFFSAGHRHVLGEVFAARPHIRSFRELDHFLREEFPGIYKSLGISKKEFEEATHLYTVVHSLASFDALNVLPSDPPRFEHRIEMSSIVRHPQVAYFFLPASVEQKSVREIARLALHSLLTAASERGRSKHEVCLIIDEFAQVVDTALEIVLQQARDMGISAILANHSLAQLQNMSANLIPTVSSNTRCRWFFSTGDPDQQDRLLKIAGETAYSLNGWLQAAQAYLSGTTVPRLVANGRSNTPLPGLGCESFPFDRVTAQRLNRNDLLELSNHPLRAVVQFTRQAGYTCFGGYPFPIQCEFHISPDEYRVRQNAPWPDLEPHTLAQAPDSPCTPSIATQGPPPSEPPPSEPGALVPANPRPPHTPVPALAPAPPATKHPARARPNPKTGSEQALLRGIDAL